MTERPILFSAPMVRALLDGSKTQTRRVVKDLPPWTITEIVPSASGCGLWLPNGPAPSGRGMASGHWRPCPYGQPGDRLWVKESYRFLDTFDDASPAGVGDRSLLAGYPKPWAPLHFEADGARREWKHVSSLPPCGLPQPGKLRPSIHMPRWASRILLEVVSVRVERLNECSEADALAEGVRGEPCDHIRLSCEEIGCCGPTAQGMYAALWEQINGAGSWDANPWVWVVEFRRVAK